MREPQLIRSILDRALQKAGESNARRIQSLQLAVGEIAELDQDVLREHWDRLSRGTPAEHARLHLRLIRAEVQCMACFQKYYPQHGEIHCPYCGSYGAKILAGEEFFLESVELEE